MSKKIIIFGVIGLAVIGLVSFKVLRPKAPDYELVMVKRGTVVQSVSETGTIRTGEIINLGFKTGGTIEEILVEVGDGVEIDQALARLKTNQLVFQCQETQAALKAAQANLNKLLAGATPKEIQVVQTGKDNAQKSVELAEKNLDNAYQASLNILDSSELAAINAKNAVTGLYRSYFELAGQIETDKLEIEEAVSAMEIFNNTARETKSSLAIDKALVETEGSLLIIKQGLNSIRELLEKTPYVYLVSSTNKTLIDTQRTNINTVLISLTETRQGISSLVLSLDLTRGQLQLAEDNLSLALSPARQEDIDLYQAQILQAQSQSVLCQDQIKEATLKSPIKARVAKINKRAGEVALGALHDPIISLIPRAPFQIRVDVYEEDIIKVKIDNPVVISLPVLPDEFFSGRVISIEPAEKLVDGVVYYEMKIDFADAPEGARHGMSADVEIETARKENVLAVPLMALQKENGRYFVEIESSQAVVKKEVVIGLKGSDGLVEIISGLDEGEKVIIR